MRVLVIHPLPLVQDGLAVVIRSFVPEAEVLPANDPASAPADQSFDRAIVDVSQSDVAPLSLLAAFRARFPGVPFAVASAAPLDAGTMFGAAQLGAVSQLPLASDMATIRQTVGRLLGAESDASPAPVAPVIAKSAQATFRENAARVNLTARQMEVLQLLLCGLSNKRISRHLDLSPSTVKIHVSAVLRALNVRSRTEAVVAASERGIAATRPVALEPRVRPMVPARPATTVARPLPFAPY